MKRDNWTNDEVIDILEGMKTIGKDGVVPDTDHNMTLDLAISQFWDFQKSVDEFAAMAYDPEKKEIVVVGPPLPR